MLSAWRATVTVQQNVMCGVLIMYFINSSLGHRRADISMYYDPRATEPEFQLVGGAVAPIATSSATPEARRMNPAKEP